MSSSNTSNARDEITALKKEIEEIPNDLGHQPIAPRQRLAEQKVHIAPVNLATFDVLSFIFEICAENDWRAPLRIGGVSRFWRDTVLHTPRAWCFLDLGASCDDFRDAYFERSGQCGLHIAIGLPDICEPAQVAPVAHRIHCMTTLALLDSMICPVYPCLKSLQVLSHDWLVSGAVFTLSRFPSLRHLEIDDVFDENEIASQIPPLETLVITAYDEDGWPELIEACKYSLISLRITMNTSIESDCLCIDLPNLRHLEVLDGDGYECHWACKFTTPALKTYIESIWDQSCPDDWREALKSISYLRLSRPPSLSVTLQLRILQLTLSIEQLRRFLEDLKVLSLVFPQLELLEFLGSAMREPDKIAAGEILNKWDGNNFPRLVGPLSISQCRSMDLPGESERMVRNLLHGVIYCHSDTLFSVEGIFPAAGGRMIAKMVEQQDLPLASSENRIELPPKFDYGLDHCFYTYGEVRRPPGNILATLVVA